MKTSRKTMTMMAAGLLAVGGASIAVGAGAGGEDDYSASLAAKIDPARPKNVILLVGDGMGDSEVTLARYYGKGANGRLNMDRFAFRGSSIHYVLSPGPGPNYAPNYVGDSAPTATAWSTGKKTQDNRLSQGPSTAFNIPGSNAGYKTYMEIARDRGKATGDVTTAEITDATPAGPSAHISQRGCQGPADARVTTGTPPAGCLSETKANGGLGSIAEQQVDEGFDLYLGGGKGRYEQPLDTNQQTTTRKTVVDYATEKGYSVIDTEAQLKALTPGQKAIGLFNSSNMTTEYAPLFARTDAYLAANVGADPVKQQSNGGSATTRCQTQARGEEPSLPEMTTKAIDLLDDDPQGFTLQVEGASIDKRDHSADICGQIGETLAFDDAVGVALDYQREHPETLVIMTADHAHSSQMINANAKPATGSSYGTVQTVDGAPIRVSYGTKDTGNDATSGSSSQAHTGAEVPVWATGPQAANIQGSIDETDIFAVLNGKAPSKLSGASQGPAGQQGPPGSQGPVGNPGPVGSPGPAGTNGTNGTNGAAGPNGNNGAAGKNGRDGRDTKVRCVIGRRKVICTTNRTGTARLVRGARTIARASIRGRRVTFRKPARGRYAVVIGARRSTIRVR